MGQLSSAFGPLADVAAAVRPSSAPFAVVTDADQSERLLDHEIFLEYSHADISPSECWSLQNTATQFLLLEVALGDRACLYRI